MAFYTKFNPVQHQKEAVDWLKFETEGKKYLDQLAEYSLGKYEFRDTNWDSVKNLENTLIVAVPKDIPDGIPLLKTVRDPQGKEIFQILESLSTPLRLQRGESADKKVLSTSFHDQTQEGLETEIVEQQVTEEVATESRESLSKVIEVIDGDTIRLETGEVVRYIGIDAPEKGKCYYTEAKNRNRELVEGKEVVLERDVSEMDRFGRILRYLFLDGQLVNEILVSEGFAKSYYYPPDLVYHDKFVQAQNQAREQNLGLWGIC